MTWDLVNTVLNGGQLIMLVVVLAVLWHRVDLIKQFIELMDLCNHQSQLLQARLDELRRD